MTALKHGHALRGAMSKTYNTWVNMIGRCTRPYHSGYARYGAIGVSVCDRWLVFENFLADMGERPAGKTIDREKGAMIYNLENCRWATLVEQQRNVKSNVLVIFQGRTMCLSAWAEETGIKRDTLDYRIARGWGDRAFTTPPKLGNRVMPYQAPTSTLVVQPHVVSRGQAA